MHLSKRKILQKVVIYDNLDAHMLINRKKINLIEHPILQAMQYCNNCNAIKCPSLKYEISVDYLVKKSQTENIHTDGMTLGLTNLQKVYMQLYGMLVINFKILHCTCLVPICNEQGRGSLVNIKPYLHHVLSHQCYWLWSDVRHLPMSAWHIISHFCVWENYQYLHLLSTNLSFLTLFYTIQFIN